MFYLSECLFLALVAYIIGLVSGVVTSTSIYENELRKIRRERRRYVDR